MFNKLAYYMYISILLRCFHMPLSVVYFDWKTVIMSPKQSLGDILCMLHFLLLLHHPDCCRVMYCYSTFLFHYYSYSYKCGHRNVLSKRQVWKQCRLGRSYCSLCTLDTIHKLFFCYKINN
jgi:hypothetical protein